MPEKPSIPEQEPLILSFEEFSHRDPKPRYRNFFAYFAGGFAGETYRKSAHYKRFAEKHPDMAEALCDKIQTQRNVDQATEDSLAPFDRDLYEAYIIMRGYGASDSELFV